MCLPAVRLMDDSLPASQPSISPGGDRYRALKITLNNGLLHPIYENVILKAIISLRHGDSLYFLPILSSLPTNMHIDKLHHDHVTMTFRAR